MPPAFPHRYAPTTVVESSWFPTFLETLALNYKTTPFQFRKKKVTLDSGKCGISMQIIYEMYVFLFLQGRVITTALS